MTRDILYSDHFFRYKRMDKEAYIIIQKYDSDNNFMEEIFLNMGEEFEEFFEEFIEFTKNFNQKRKVGILYVIKD